MRHRDHHVLHAALGGVVHDLVEDRDHHVEALDRKARLAGERAMQEPLERLDLRDASEQLVAVDRIVGRAELPGLDRLPQPHALVRHEHVVVVVAGGRAVDLPQLRDRLEGVRGAGGGRPRHDRRRQLLQRVGGEAVRLRRERRIADRIVKAKRIEPRGEMAEAADRLGKIEGGDAGLNDAGDAGAAGARGCMRVPDGIGGRPGSKRPAGRLVDRRGIALVALEQLVDIPRVGP